MLVVILAPTQSGPFFVIVHTIALRYANTMLDNDYINRLKERSTHRQSVHHKHQFTGMEIATMLEDTKHKALYMLLAKQKNNQRLFEIVKTIAESKTAKNKGANFMKIAKEEGLLKGLSPAPHHKKLKQKKKMTQQSIHFTNQKN